MVEQEFIDSEKTILEILWIKDFKNSVFCPFCEQQFNWENYEQEREVFIAKHRKCPFCDHLNVIEYKRNAVL